MMKLTLSAGSFILRTGRMKHEAMDASASDASVLVTVGFTLR